MKPDYDKAAIAAMQLLIDFHVQETPINPMQFLLKHSGTRIISFSRMANEADQERDGFIPLFCENQDAATFHLNSDIDTVDYVVVYNMRLPSDIVSRALARELGHIILGHDGSTRPYSVRRAEAICFAHHLISPRPVLRMLQASGPLTMNMLADTTGCIDECAEDMSQIPGAHVPASMNRTVRDLFSGGINEYIRFRNSGHKKDHSPVINLGTFMDNYEE